MPPPNGRAARREVEANRRFGLMPVDLVMPADEPDGLVFATRAKAQVPNVPIIAMAAYYGFVARAGALPAAVPYEPIDTSRSTWTTLHGTSTPASAA
jgi:CheY-like chemotaxis protein